MKRKPLFFLAVIPALLFTFLLASCHIKSDSDYYTVKFKIQNNSSLNITRVDFINGSNTNAEVLDSETDELVPNARSDEYKVFGFTESDGSDDKHYCGILVTFDNEDNETLFNWSSASSDSKVLVTVTGTDWPFLRSNMTFSEGDW
jgi:hypothetical protein